MPLITSSMNPVNTCCSAAHFSPCKPGTLIYLDGNVHGCAVTRLCAAAVVLPESSRAGLALCMHPTNFAETTDGALSVE